MSSRALRPVLLASLLLGACNEFEISVPSSREIFAQSPWEKVDVLLVVDNSCSMEPYQEKLASDFGGFFDFFAEGQVDWHLAVVHTDGRSDGLGRIRGPIVTPDAIDPEALFAEVVHVGTEGGGLEVGLEAADLALNGRNAEFPRDDASVSVIFVSDEQDSSPGSVAEYVDSFLGIKGPRSPEGFNASALTVSELADCTPDQFQASTPGTRYIETALLTGGISANLCVDAFDTIVHDLALTTSTMLDTFFLGSRPDLNTLTVFVDEQLVPCDDGSWSYALVERDGVQRPAIVFAADLLPEAGAKIAVEYTHGRGDPADFCPEGAP